MALMIGVCTALAAQTPTGTSLRQIVDAGRLDDLRWPDFSDYRLNVKKFYEPANYEFAWIRSGKPTTQAVELIRILQQAEDKGLGPDDYDGPQWAQSMNRVAASDADDTRFEAALTVCVMRYVSDLRIGKVNPKYFSFGLDIEHKKYDLPKFVRQQVVNAPDVKSALDGVEPSYPGYRRAQAALKQYLEFARQDDGERLPVPAKTVVPGSDWPGVPRLTRLLRLVGDLPSDAPAPVDQNLYSGAVVDAVKRYQGRHGLPPDGRLGAQTIKSLNVPLKYRVRQLQLTLERWRWLPQDMSAPPVVVNIPEFRLRAYNDQTGTRVAFESNVIVGKSYSKTPVFIDSMEYVVLRPYWNVPPSIQRSEIVPAIGKDREYVSRKGYEVTTPRGDFVTSGAIKDDVLERLRAGTLVVRQKPGPAKALGLVKLIFPNSNNVYLHSTPAQTLFAQSQRTFSHGCIRVRRAAELTAWALRNTPGWDLEHVRKEMESGRDNQRVNLAKAIPVLILYGTAVVDDAGQAHFFEDIYASMPLWKRSWPRVTRTRVNGGERCSPAANSAEVHVDESRPRVGAYPAAM
jgi:murein L,D-transpeptidase YcbB/YkuD